MEQEEVPLASLSLTHVHYVRPLLSSHLRHLHRPLLFLSFVLRDSVTPLTTNILTESQRPSLLPLRLACPGPTSTMRHLRDPDLGVSRSGDPAHVCRPDVV